MDDKKTLLTIITEANLEEQIIEDINTFKIAGYTISEAHGKGNRGVRDASWENSGNVRIEIITPLETAKNFAKHCKESYYEDFAMIIYFTDVAVMRPEKF